MDALRLARDAYARRDWAIARDRFTAARKNGPLTASDVVALADSAWWLGLNDEALAGYEEAYRLYVHDDQVPKAARLAMDIAFLWRLRGDSVIASGWMSRARRLLQDLPHCIEHGYLLSVEVDEALAAMDFDGAIVRARQVQAIATRFDDQTLHCAGLLAEGTA